MTDVIVRREIVQVLNDLPETCATRMPGTGAPITVRRGVKGYWLIPDPHFDVEAFNARNGVTDAQAEAMLAGSVFGFDVPAADPLNCGKKKKKYRVTYPLITTEGYQDFATKKEAEAFARAKRDEPGRFQTFHSWNHIRVDEVEG